MKNLLYEMAAIPENEVFSMPPVCEISSTPIIELEGDGFKTFIMDNISSIPIDTKYTVTIQTIGEIYSHHCVGRNLKKAALLALPHVLNANHVISPWRKGRNKKQLSGEVGAPILIDGAKYLCNVTLLRNANNKITPYAITLKDASLSIITEKKVIGNISVHNSNSKNSAFGDIHLSKIATSQDANTPLKLGTKINEINDKSKYYNKNLKENITMINKKKQIVRLTESDLHRVIKESVKKVLNEHRLDFNALDCSAQGAYELCGPESNTPQALEKKIQILDNFGMALNNAIQLQLANLAMMFKETNTDIYKKLMDIRLKLLHDNNIDSGYLGLQYVDNSESDADYYREMGYAEHAF